MPYDPFNSSATIRAMLGRLSAFDSTASVRAAYGRMSAMDAASDLVRNYQNSVFGAAGLGQVTLDLFASNWKVADSIIRAGAYQDLQLGFGSQSGLEAALENLFRPKFDAYRDSLLVDFAYGTSSLKTISDISAGLGPASFLALQGQLLSDSYTQFIEGLGANAISGVLGSAGLSAATANLERASASLALIVDSVESAQEPRLQPVKPNWFELLHEDLEDLSDGGASLSSDEAAQAVAETPAGQLAGIASKIINLRKEINVGSETTVGKPIFKPTTKEDYAAGLLGLDVVESRVEFDRYNERLYTYFYEASGEWKRVKRYVAEFPKVVERIKHFRLYSAHDTQHGSEAEIKRKAKQIGLHLQELTGQPIPGTREGWRAAQLALLRELAEFLQHLLKQVVHSTPSA